MRALSDKWNPRLWLRDWLNRPSRAEMAERQAAELAARHAWSELTKEHTRPVRTAMAANDAAMAAQLSVTSSIASDCRVQ